MNPKTHHQPKGISDRVAYYMVRGFRYCADLFFGKRYIHRAVVIETIAAVPGMVGALLLHLKSLRRLEDHHNRVRTLVEEAENERVHLMVYASLSRPTFVEWCIIIAAQVCFFLGYFCIYLVSPKIGHRIVGYLEEEAVRSYEHFLAMIDSGAQPNVPAPQLAIDYWRLLPDATLHDVVLATRADEERHRDANHAFADEREVARG